MGLFDHFPYTNLHELNLDLLLNKMKELQQIVENFISLNTIKYANPIQWNITTQYEANTVVIDANDGTAYLSVQAVPTGVAITNTDYWTPIFTLNLLSSNQNITLRDDGSNVLATFSSVADDWLIWNATLYKVTQPININEAYVVGYNLTRYSVELFINDYVSNILNIIGDLNNLSTTDKDSIVDAINEINGALRLHSCQYLNPKSYGAVLDGVTDDTSAIASALAAGNVRLPKEATVKLNNLVIPNNRIIDFNDSLVVTDSTAFAIGDINDSLGYNYTQKYRILLYQCF